MDNRVQLMRRITGDVVREARRYRSAADAALAQFELSDATALPVLILARLGRDVRQGVLATEMGVEGPSLVRLVDLLVESGLVERMEDPDDRRARRLTITAAGGGVASQAEVALDGLRARLFDGVADEDLAACVRVLAALTAALDAPGEGGRG